MNHLFINFRIHNLKVLHEAQFVKPYICIISFKIFNLSHFKHENNNHLKCIKDLNKAFTYNYYIRKSFMYKQVSQLKILMRFVNVKEYFDEK